MSDSSEFTLTAFDDLHCHLRESSQSLVAKTITSGGCDRVLVMPNLKTPVVTCEHALKYRNFLLEINPGVDYLMTLYLSSHITISDLEMNASKCHVQGCYPKDTTTNSSYGVEDFVKFYPLFKCMEKLSLSLHIHCESIHCDPLFAEQKFIPELHEICNKFPGLKIVVEHVSSKEMVEFVKKTPNIAATVTLHHMELLSDDVVSKYYKYGSSDDISNFIINPHNYCKPLPKTAEDRDSILEVITAGHPRFYFGSDSAPHLINDKLGIRPPPGIFSQPYLALYLVDLFSRLNCLDKLESFVSHYGRDYLNLPEKRNRKKLTFVKKPFQIPELEYAVFRPYKAGQYLSYSMAN